jgi:Tol biopolymer transport system component
MRRKILAALIVLGVLTLPATPADATHTHRHGTASTKGVIVWTQRTDEGLDHLVIALADGSHQKDLTPAIADSGDIDAQISPDGKWVAYEHDAPGADTVRLVRTDGSRDHLLDVGCVAPCGGTDAPTWLSNDRIAFLRVVGPLNEKGDAASAVLYTIRPDGSHLRRLSEPGIDGKYEDRYARLSADRSYLTFQRLRLADNRTALFRMALDGSHVRQLTPWGLNADLYDLSTARSGPTKNLIVFQSIGRGNPDETFIDMGFLPQPARRWLTARPRSSG